MTLRFVVSRQEHQNKLSLFLRKQGLSSALIRTVKFQENGILVNKEQAKTNWIVKQNDIVEFCLPEDDDLPLKAEEIPLKILYENQDFIAINKPAGMVMHPTRTHKSGTVGNAYTAMMQKRNQSSAFRAVGRLDAGTSGVVICALHAYSAQQLAKNMKKVYFALVHGKMPLEQGCINTPIGKAEDSVIQQQVCANGKPSITNYEVMASSEKASLVAVFPKTGRTHQIRVHFSSIGHSLIGDSLYGTIAQNIVGHHLLHCTAVSVKMPLQKPIEIFSEIPESWYLAAQAMEITIPTKKILKEKIKQFMING